MFPELLRLLLFVTGLFSFASPRPAAASEIAGFDPSLAPFDVRFGDVDVPYREFLATVLPGQTVEIGTGEPVEASSSAGIVSATAPDRWRWQAPSTPGIYPVWLAGADDTVLVRAAVLVPYREMRRGVLHGYRIGAYPRSRHGDPAYARPAGFIEVTEANRSIGVSPHFRLEQFVCKSGAVYPKYLVLQPRLIEKLERLLDEVNREGLRAETFHVMSAYRTPRYNRAIGNSTTFTRHQYGDAADIFIDRDPEDGRMDDLDADRRLTRMDAALLGRLADRSDHSAELANLAGGMSTYEGNGAHGPFVHVDTRGAIARW